MVTHHSSQPNKSNSGTSSSFFSKPGEGSSFFGDNESRGEAFWGQPLLQPKLTIGQPNDKYEQEADAMADQVVQKLSRSDTVQRKCTACEQEEGGIYPKIQTKAIFESSEEASVQRKCSTCAQKDILPTAIQMSGGQRPNLQASGDLEARLNSSKGGGHPLPEHTRESMSNAFGTDFSGVRVHTGSGAAQMNQELGAKAFTNGSDIYFNSGEYNPQSIDGQHLLAHELTHVVQQGGTKSIPAISKKSAPLIQRRLIVFGTRADTTSLTGLLGPNAGLALGRDVLTSQIQIAAVLPGAPPSPTLRARLTTIINDPNQHAEIALNQAQPGVLLGAFPQPPDLTATRVQRVDIDDLLALEAGAPGNGVALAMHEIEENYQAHGVPAVPGNNRFPNAHQAAIDLAESPVAAELVGPGRRIAEIAVAGTIVPSFVLNIMGRNVNVPGFVNPVAGTAAIFLDFENYYLGFTMRTNTATGSADIINAQRFPVNVVSRRVIDSFPSGNTAVPGAGAAIIAAAVADVAANPTSTVRVRGFSDNVGSAAGNLTISGRRANNVAAALTAAGVAPIQRIHSEGLGETSFVAPNLTAADRARNRRVEITVTTPQL